MRVRAAQAATNLRGPQAEGLGALDAEDPSTVPAPVSTLRERLTRLNHPTKSGDFAGAPVHLAPPRPRPQRTNALPRGFEQVTSQFGVAAVRQDVIPLPRLDPDPGSVASVDTETTGLAG